MQWIWIQYIGYKGRYVPVNREFKGSFSNEDGDGGDEGLQKSFYILPLNVAAVWICSVGLSV